MIAGIDEAGRGPVFGSMVMAILATDDEDKLKRMGVQDSKELSPAKREQLFETLQEYEHEIIALSPAEIDAAVESPKDNLNLLEARTTALLISRLAKRVPFEKVIVDSPAKNGSKYETIVRKTLSEIDPDLQVEIVCEIKADANYPVVGAASILAKVTRDRELAQLSEEHGPLGSGYPADPATQAFLHKHWRDGHSFFRKSWASFKNAGQSSLTEFDDTKHRKEIEEFEFLKDHGFVFQEPTNQYEVVRMKKGKTSVIKYTTGKVVVQGPEKEAVEKLLA